MNDTAFAMQQVTGADAASDGLVALIAAAVRSDPARVLFEDDHRAATARQVAHRVDRLADQLRAGSLQPGEHVLVVVGAQVEAPITIAAALQAGLRPVLAACDLGPVDLAAIARAASAAALIGPSRYGDLDLGETYLSTAALAEGVRGVLTFGCPAPDGAMDVSMPVLDGMDAPDRPAPPSEIAASTIVTVAAPRSGSPRLIPHDGHSLAAAARSVIDALPLAPGGPVLSLISPATLASLAGGLFAALLRNQRYVLHGPFDGASFLARCDGAGAYSLLAPAGAATALVESGVTRGAASLVLVSRSEQITTSGGGGDAGCPVLDLDAFGERSIRVARRPEPNGDAVERWRSDRDEDGSRPGFGRAVR